MLPLPEAKELLRFLVAAVKPSLYGEGLGGHRRIPRPALVQGSLGEFDLQPATLPLLEVMEPAQLHEVFAGFSDCYLTPDGDKIESTFGYVKSSFQLLMVDYPMLFPSRRGPIKYTLEDATYAIGIMLWCAKAMGYELEYSEDYALVQCGEHTIGVRDGKVVCGYPGYCLPVAPANWQKFYEEPRETGDSEPLELFTLYTRARSWIREDHEKLTSAVQVLTWAAHRYVNLLSSLIFPSDAPLTVGTHTPKEIETRVVNSDDPVGTLEEIAVPAFTTLEEYQRITVSFSFDGLLWEIEDCETFLGTVLPKLGIKYNNNNKKGKSHVDSNHRQGAGR